MQGYGVAVGLESSSSVWIQVCFLKLQ
jgi:hypothetical protein